MRRSAARVSVALVASLFVGPADAVVIDFDGLPCGTAVTTQFPEATFSSDPGFENRTACDFDLGTAGLANRWITEYVRITSLAGNPSADRSLSVCDPGETAVAQSDQHRPDKEKGKALATGS